MVPSPPAATHAYAIPSNRTVIPLLNHVQRDAILAKAGEQEVTALAGGSPLGLRGAFEAFLIDAEASLTREHVLPRPRYAPWIKVGADYFGPDLARLPTFKRLESAIEATDDRFTEGAALGDRDFASRYAFSALEYYVARRTRGDVAAVESAYEALREGLSVPCTMASAWAVTDITTSAADSLRIAGVQVHRLPEVGAGARAEIAELLREVFGERADGLDQDRLPHPFSDAALLVATHHTSKTFEADAVPASSMRIRDVVLAVRLLHAATVHNVYEIRGGTASVGHGEPTIYEFEGAGQGMMSAGLEGRRAVRLTHNDEAGISTVIALLHAQLGTDAEPSSLHTAVSRYQMSHNKHVWSDKIIDLSIALEASLAGDRNTEITLRLQSRAAALLATAQDPETALFDDVRHFYALRSRMVHGSAPNAKAMEKLLRKISRIPQGEHFNRFWLDAVTDRLRDIVRRAILARLVITAQAPELWPRDDAGLDRTILTTEGKNALRSAWRMPLLDLGQTAAIEAAPPLKALS